MTRQRSRQRSKKVSRRHSKDLGPGEPALPYNHEKEGVSTTPFLGDTFSYTSVTGGTPPQWKGGPSGVGPDGPSNQKQHEGWRQFPLENFKDGASHLAFLIYSNRLGMKRYSIHKV